MDVKQQVLEILSNGPITLTEIKAKMNCCRTYTEGALRELLCEGKVTVSRHGRYAKYALYKLDKGKYPPNISDLKALDIANSDTMFYEMPMKEVYKTLAHMGTKVYRRWNDGSVTWLS